jgi:hypothetical protein
MAITSFTSSNDRDDYDYLMNRYKREGLDMFFYDYQLHIKTKLGELKHSEIIDYIKYLDKPKTHTDKAWYKIMNKVLIKQRQLKLEKIKSRL